MNQTTNILLAGVGGQGTILASKVLAEVAMLQGFDVKISEIHGMAQRGGSVITHVKFGEKVYSPLIEAGQADFMVAFELLEALRRVHYLQPNGVMIVNEQRIEPMSVITGKETYPTDIEEQLSNKASYYYKIPALKLANELGNVRTVNMILLGCLAKQLEIAPEQWFEAMAKHIKPRYLEINKQALMLGWEIV